MKTTIVFLFLLCCLPALADESKLPVKIGVIADLSGHISYWGKQTALGARLAEKDIRAEGKNVDVIVGDSTFKPATAISEFQKMLLSDKIDALFTESPPIVNALSPIVRNANKLLMGSSATASFVDINPLAFKSFLDTAKGCEGVARIWKAQGIEKPALLRLAFEQGDICHKGVVAVYGEVPEVIFEPGETLASQILRLKRDKIDGVIFVGYEADSLNLIKALSEAKYFPYIAAQADIFCVANHLDRYQALLDKITTFGFAPLPSEFEQKILNADPNNSPVARSAVAISYLAVRQMYDVVSQCPKDDINCQVQKMTESKPSELLSFQGYKNRIAEYDYQYISWKGGRALSLSNGSQSNGLP